ncbi:MAG: YceI family protein [Sphingomonadales bacterium]|nr:YceI family protein [Sphingomonadales bacterium]
MNSRFNLRRPFFINAHPFSIFLWGLVMTTVSSSAIFGQASGKYMTRTGSAHFVADGVIKDDVQAKTNTVTAVLDGATGQVQVRIPVNSFLFRKALMQEHFNENYLESHQFPFAIFKGQVSNWDSTMMQKSGSQKIRFTGKLEIHGTTKDVVEPGTMEVSGGQIRMMTDMMVTVADYGIKIPALVRDKIAKEAAVHVEVNLKPSGQ